MNKEQRIRHKVAKYNAMSSEIQKNLNAIQRKYPESKALDLRRDFAPISTQQPNERTLNTLIKKAQNILDSGALSMDAQERSRALAIDTLRKDGLDFVNNRNFKNLMKFLDDARARGLGALYTSEQLISAVQEAKRKGLTKAQIRANIQYWADKMLKYDKDGKLIEPDEYKPLNILRSDSKTMAKYKAKVRERIRREKKGQ